MDVLLNPANLAQVLREVQQSTGMLWYPLNPLVRAAVREAAEAALRGVHASDLTVYEFNTALRERLVQLSDPSQARARGQHQPHSRRPERTQPERSVERLHHNHHILQRAQEIGARRIQEAAALLSN